MVLHQYNSASYLDTKIQEFWSTFKSDILRLTLKSWKEEDYVGKSYTQWNVMQYHNVLSLVILLYLDVRKNSTVHTTWAYYNTKYKLDTYRKCLANDCIDLDKVLTIFGFPFQDLGEGIQSMEIEETFEIQGETCTGRCLRVLEDGTPRVIEGASSLRVLENCN